MGVTGLWSLLEGNSQIYTNIHFRDSKLVVDGSSLAHHIYNMANLDQNHGGEYLAFQVEVQAFFKNLADCGIKPYVLLDGGSGPSDIKLNRRMDLQRQRVKKIPDALKGGNLYHNSVRRDAERHECVAGQVLRTGRRPAGCPGQRVVLPGAVHRH